MLIFIINLCLFVQGPTSMFVAKHDETNQISVRKVDIKCVNTTKMHANSHVQFDTCTVSYTCQTVRHVQIDTRITRVKRACDELHNLTRVLKYTCQV
jgi:hypothetical protein